LLAQMRTRRRPRRPKGRPTATASRAGTLTA
jgi:hypothetical protein